MDITTLNGQRCLHARRAFWLGSVCAVSYLAVYTARNVLSICTPSMVAEGFSTTETIGTLSSAFFLCYAVGQLVNGIIGDRVKAGTMLSGGLVLAGLCHLSFPYLSAYPHLTLIAYGLTGYFLSMIYGPMTKVSAESVELVYAVRCCLAYTFVSYLGSPLAGILAFVFRWQRVFDLSSIILLGMGAFCFVQFRLMERTGAVRYIRYGHGEDGVVAKTAKGRCDEKAAETEKGSKLAGIRILLEREIVRFTFVSILTGIVRTTVVFWLPSYLTQQLGFSAKTASVLFAAGTFLISLSVFVAAFLYECFRRNTNLVVLISFLTASLFFLLTYAIPWPVWNISFLILAILFSNCAASMLWGRYCPGFGDTGMCSSVTGFLDFMSYMAASVSSTVFADAVSAIGWEGLILVWIGLMAVGVVVMLPFKKRERV